MIIPKKQTYETSQKKIRCTCCGSLNTQRRGKRNGKIRTYCHDCKKCPTLNHKNKKANKLLRKHLNRNSYRLLEDEEKMSRKTIYSLVNKAMGQLIDSNDLTKLMKPQNYSGIILIDGKYVPVKYVDGKSKGLVPRSKKRRGKTKKGLVILPFMDYLTHDIPIYITALSENTFDIERGFQKLKEIGYPLKIIVCDESMGKIAQVARKFFPDVIIQICLTHYSQNIDREFRVNGAKRTMKALENKLFKLGDSIFIPTRHYDIEKGRKLVNELADLEYKYDYLIKVQGVFQEIFWGAKTMEELSEAEDRLNETVGWMNLKSYPYAERIKKRYLDYYEKRKIIITAIQNPELNIPRTTNLIEGFNSTTLEIRFSSIRGFEKEETAKTYINALILKRRFQKFKDCKKKFKKLNGKSPLKIAQPLNDFGFNFDEDNWINFCQKLKKENP